MTHEKRLALAREMNARLAAIRQAGQIATRDLIRKDGLTADEITGLVGLYPIWQPDTEYPVDDLIAHEGILYQVVQGHTSQSGWEPPNVPALFVSKTQPELSQNGCSRPVPMTLIMLVTKSFLRGKYM